MQDAKLLDLDVIRLDPGLQCRRANDPDTINDYAEKLRDDVEFPPIVVFNDEAGVYWCADGFHRVYAHRAADKTTIRAVVREGSRRDALRFALGANETNGLHLSSDDKQRKVEMVLADDEWCAWSVNAIKDSCKVSWALADRVKREWIERHKPATATPGQVTYQRDGVTGTMQTANLGKKKDQPAEPPPPTDNPPSSDPKPADAPAVPESGATPEVPVGDAPKPVPIDPKAKAKFGATDAYNALTKHLGALKLYDRLESPLSKIKDAIAKA